MQRPRHAAALYCESVARFDGVAIPETLISQYLPRVLERVRDGKVPPQPRAVLLESVADVLRTYANACR